MPSTDIIVHPSLNGPHEAAVLGGGAQSRTDIGVTQYGETGNETNKLHTYGGRVVEIGDVFVRPIEQAPGETAEPSGAYTWFGGAGQLRGAERFRFVAPFVSTPGQPMSSPAGTPIFVDEVRVTTPTTGEQDRDPWTGALLFEADGTTPILIP
jgi:hypothetical protein